MSSIKSAEFFYELKSVFRSHSFFSTMFRKELYLWYRLTFSLSLSYSVYVFFCLLYGTFASLHSQSFRKEKWKSSLCRLQRQQHDDVDFHPHTTSSFFCSHWGSDCCCCCALNWTPMEWIFSSHSTTISYFFLRILISATHFSCLKWKRNKASFMF